jgi:cardiolipin synthase
MKRMLRKIRQDKSKYTSNNSLRLIRGGAEYFDVLVELIAAAKSSIHVQVYILDADETGNRVADALIAAAGRGVQVYVLADGYASRGLPLEFRSKLVDAGVNFRMFEPLLRTSNFYFGRRLHHKIIVVDSQHSLVSGINISDRYNDIGGIDAWLDWGVYCEGEISADLFKVCVDLWFHGSPQKRRQALEPLDVVKAKGGSRVRVRRNDWVRSKTQISRSYQELLRRSQKQVTIMSSYFIPGAVAQTHLRRAARRGVKIRLILAGTSDIYISKFAERHIYKWLLDHNIEVYEYQPTVLHGKMAVFDEKYVTAGSYNINNISAFASIELNLEIDDEAFASQVNSQFDEIIKKDCVKITDEIYRTHSVLKRFVHWSAYNVVRVLFYVSTFYFRQGR